MIVVGKGFEGGDELVCGGGDGVEGGAELLAGDAVGGEVVGGDVRDIKVAKDDVGGGFGF